MKTKFTNWLLQIKRIVFTITIITLPMVNANASDSLLCKGPEIKVGFGHQIINYFEIYGPIYNERNIADPSLRPFLFFEYQRQIAGRFRWFLQLNYQRNVLVTPSFLTQHGTDEFEVYQKFYFSDVRLGFGVGAILLKRKFIKINSYLSYSYNLGELFLSSDWFFKVRTFYTGAEINMNSNYPKPQLFTNDAYVTQFDTYNNFNIQLELEYELTRKISIFNRNYLGYNDFGDRRDLPWKGAVFSRDAAALIAKLHKQYYVIPCFGINFNLRN